jgi:hypothetical protein
MHVGVNVPIIDFRADLVGLRDFLRAAEEPGYGHVRMLDHVLGADLQFPIRFHQVSIRRCCHAEHRHSCASDAAESLEDR